jgi:hypothetical protein
LNILFIDLYLFCFPGQIASAQGTNSGLDTSSSTH